MNTFNLRTRQELMGNNLLDIIDDYAGIGNNSISIDELRVIVDELVSYLNDNQLDQIEDLIVNNYGEDS